MADGFYCEICLERIPHPETDNVVEGIRYAADHFANMHPEIEIPRWPDGEPVTIVQSDPPWGPE